MRIIAGKARGTKLFTLEGDTTRPTLDRVKESIFNIIQNDIYDSIFLDLFSGSGAIGLEAVSRGARKAILCDLSKSAINIIKKNIEKTHFENQVELYNLHFEDMLKNLKEQINIIYMDPPYKTDYIEKALKIIEKKPNITEETKIIIETDDEEKIINSISDLNFEIIDKRKYGIAFIIFIQKKPEKGKEAC